MMGWTGQASYMQSHKLPTQLIAPMLAIALLIEAAGVLCLILGWQARSAAFVMFIYLGVVSVLLHNFWAGQGATAGAMQTQFFKNLAIMGGMLLLTRGGAGGLSIDGRDSSA